jgi:hypothetical protein
MTLAALIYGGRANASRNIVIEERLTIGIMLVLKCSCGWTIPAEAKDPTGIFLKDLKNIHEMTFTDHKVVIE